MLPFPLTLVKVKRAASALYRSSRTGKATNHGEDLGGEATTQKTPNIHSRTENEPPLSQTPATPPRATDPLGNQRRQHLNPDDYTVIGDRIVPLSLISTATPCRTDDPLRALQGSRTAAQDFCWSYVRVQSQIRPLPTYLSQFDYDQITSACICFYATGVLHLSPPIPKATIALPQGPTSVPGTGKRTQRQSLSSSLMPNPAIEDATYSRPHEYHGPDATSAATITASKSPRRPSSQTQLSPVD